MYNNDIKLFSKNKKELETLIQIVWIYSEDIEMEFDIEKLVWLIMKSGKRQMTKGINPQINKSSEPSEKRTTTSTWEY